MFESALVDGANNRQNNVEYNTSSFKTYDVIYILITSTIGGMQMLDIPFLLTDMRGAPDNKIRTTTVYLFNVGFQGRNDYAYAAAISIGVFIITVILALLIFFFIQDRSELKQTSLEKRALKLAKKGGING